ncbi:MAG: PEGA domain-containing protein [Deltaproteobacteria bacterium]|nr:PEGA domain-containing protein [Deltaproteobacteria bacterium]
MRLPATAVMGALALSALLIACAPAKPPTTSLRLAPAQDAPKNARVIIDDQPVGSLDFITKRGVALPPGKHRITIEADGYLPWDLEVDAGDKGGLIKLDVKMVKVPD